MDTEKIIIRNTGKLALGDKCKLTTRDITIQSKEIMFETDKPTCQN